MASNDSAWGIETPKDAEGRVIPLDTETLYETDGQVFHVLAFRYSPKESEWSVRGGYTGNKNGWCADTNRLLLAPPDSWEKIEEDAKKSACRYFYGPEEKDIVSCMNCKYSSQSTGRTCRVNMQIELVKRAKRLAGIEDEAQR